MAVEAALAYKNVKQKRSVLKLYRKVSMTLILSEEKDKLTESWII